MTEFIVQGISPLGLTDYVRRQLASFFPDGHEPLAEELLTYTQDALDRIHLCFQGIEKKKFRSDNRVLFNYLHPDHYAAFIYLLANTISRRDRENPLAFRLYYLNKALHGLDAYPDIELPEVFQFMHPSGTILGHAKYGNYFCVYQGCSVGSSEDGIYPEIGDYVVLYANASVIGRCKIGNNVVIGAHAMILNKIIPDNSVALATSANIKIRSNSKHVLERRFR